MDVTESLPVQLTIVLPCYNPPAGWEERLISQFANSTALLGFNPQLVLVIDGEGSVSSAKAELLKLAIPTLQIISYAANRGKGYALRRGVEIANGAIVLYTDIDFPYTEESLKKVYDTLAVDGFEIAIGVKDAEYYKHVPIVRKTVSKALQLIIRTAFNVPISDTQCGIKAFKKEQAHLFLGTTIDRYLFDLEFIRDAYRQSPVLKIAPVPVQLHSWVVFRKMNPNILFRELMNLIKVWKS